MLTIDETVPCFQIHSSTYQGLYPHLFMDSQYVCSFVLKKKQKTPLPRPPPPKKELTNWWWKWDFQNTFLAPFNP